MSDKLRTAFDYIEKCRQADRLILSGDIAGRNAVLATVPVEFRNGREIVPATS